MYIKLVLEYLESINTGGIPTILSSLERVISTELRQTEEDCKNEYMKYASQYFNVKNFPIDDEEL